MGNAFHLGEDALRELGLWPLWKLRDARAAGVPHQATQWIACESIDGRPRAEPLSGVAQANWRELRDQVANCTACGLCKQRHQAVFGVGAEDAPWLFIGEGPGADEDAQGEPFVGQAGKLLDNMFASIGIKRGREVYIANVVKCRPPGNRTPTLDEAAACATYLDRQIDLIKPKLLIALGKTAATRILGEERSLASLRSRVHQYRGFPVIVTYHPAYLLRNLPDKVKAWEDSSVRAPDLGDALAKPLIGPIFASSSTSEKGVVMRRFLAGFSLIGVLLLSGCGYNDFQTFDENVKKSWAEVVNQYKRRADLIPNLVDTVKGFAGQEKDVLLGVTNARSKVGSIQATPDLVNDPQAFAKFQAAQGELSSALSRLLVVSENYPQLKSDANFRDLQAQLEGTENRITVARKRFIDEVAKYNVLARQFPTNLTAMMFGYKEKPQFSVENEKSIAEPPRVSFGSPANAPPQVQQQAQPPVSK